MEKIRVGDPLDKNTDLGAINSKAQLEKIKELAVVGSAEGGEIWSPKCNLPQNGFWFAPTLFTGVTQAHRIAREEIFGPVLSVLTFRTPQEAIEKANSINDRSVVVEFRVEEFEKVFPMVPAGASNDARLLHPSQESRREYLK